LEDGLKIENAKYLSMFISLSKRSLEQRFFFTPVIGVFVIFIEWHLKIDGFTVGALHVYWLHPVYYKLTANA
jgi:hypothetical protein